MKAARCRPLPFAGESHAMTRSIARSAVRPPRLCVTIASPASPSGDVPILSAMVDAQVEASGDSG